MLTNSKYEANYADLMDCLRMQNKEYQELIGSKEYSLGNRIFRVKKCLRTMNFKSMRGYFRNKRWEKVVSKNTETNDLKEENRINPNDYVTNFRIAVYTCIFGNYDMVQEPLIRPDNVDYYIITDKKIRNDSAWKPLEVEGLYPNNLSNVEKNRFFKMHPDILFADYKYSIYIDGNIKVITDLTPYIKRLSAYGIGLHWHSQRRCAYKELDALLLSYKANPSDVKNYRQYLLDNNFPENFGLFECNIIVREHHNLTCKKIMSEWWDQFSRIKRDQVSLPYVLFSNDISSCDIAVLGNNVYKNYDFRVTKHV